MTHNLSKVKNIKCILFWPHLDKYLQDSLLLLHKQNCSEKLGVRVKLLVHNSNILLLMSSMLNKEIYIANRFGSKVLLIKGTLLGKYCQKDLMFYMNYS